MLIVDPSQLRFSFWRTLSTQLQGHQQRSGLHRIEGKSFKFKELMINWSLSESGCKEFEIYLNKGVDFVLGIARMAIPRDEGRSLKIDTVKKAICVGAHIDINDYIKEISMLVPY